MKRSGLVVIASLLLSLSLIASAQDQTRAHRIVTRTRLQVVFSDLESQWLKAVQRKDEATLNRALSEGFQVWTPAPPGDPIPREDWQKKAFARKLQSFQLHQMAVRAVAPEVSVASFVLTEIFDQAGKTQTEDHFVVDVWTKSGDGDQWRCTDRYSWEVSGVPHPAGAKPDVKPSGKQ
jgi:hypothetical protein